MTVEAQRGVEYQVFTPVKTYTGETAKIEFYRGRAVIDDEYARAMGYANAEEIVRILVSDFGYTSSPVLPAPVPARDPRLSLRERAMHQEREEGNVTPFFKPDPPAAESHESTIEPGGASKRGVEVTPADAPPPAPENAPEGNQ